MKTVTLGKRLKVYLYKTRPRPRLTERDRGTRL